MGAFRNARENNQQLQVDVEIMGSVICARRRQTKKDATQSSRIQFFLK